MRGAYPPQTSHAASTHNGRPARVTLLAAARRPRPGREGRRGIRTPAAPVCRPLPCLTAAAPPARTSVVSRGGVRERRGGWGVGGWGSGIGNDRRSNRRAWAVAMWASGPSARGDAAAGGGLAWAVEGRVGAARSRLRRGRPPSAAATWAAFRSHAATLCRGGGLQERAAAGGQTDALTTTRQQHTSSATRSGNSRDRGTIPPRRQQHASLLFLQAPPFIANPPVPPFRHAFPSSRWCPSARPSPWPSWRRQRWSLALTRTRRLRPPSRP